MPEGEPSTAEYAACIVDESAPVAKRIETIFLLRNIGGKEAVKAMAAGLSSPSVLLSHEIAYVLGQMQDVSALPYLEATLHNRKLDPIVRHEAAEALAAIDSEIALPLLQKYVDDEAPEVRDTCLISVERIQWRQKHPELAKTEKGASHFLSVDPAPGHTPELKGKSPEELGAALLDTKRSLFERYTAMFALRNLAGGGSQGEEQGSPTDEQCVLQLCRGFEDESAVFRHEVAYVLGQMQHAAAVPALIKALEDDAEHAMVRHEAAEALGAIKDERCEKLLKQYQEDGNQIVSESCACALSTAEYWDNFDEDATESVTERGAEVATPPS